MEANDFVIIEHGDIPELSEQERQNRLMSKIEKERKRGDNKFIKFSFIFFGIAMFYPWYCLSIDMQFFGQYYSSFYVQIVIDIIDFSVRAVFQFLLMYFKIRYKNRTQIIFGTVIACIIFLLLPITSFACEEGSSVGFGLTIVEIIILAFGHSFIVNGLVTLVSFFPKEKIILFSVGQGLSIFVAIVIEFIVISFASTNELAMKNRGSFVYFILAIILMIVFIIIFSKNYKTKYFRIYLTRSGEYGYLQKKKKKDIELPLVDSDESKTKKPRREDNFSIVYKPKEKKEYLPKENEIFRRLVKILIFPNLLHALTYTTTYTVHPFITTYSYFFFEPGSEYETAYKSITIKGIFGIGDSLGRYLVINCKTNLRNISRFIIPRVIFLILIPINYFLENVIKINLTVTACLLLVYLLIFGFLQGLGCSLLNDISPKMVEVKYKGYAGAQLYFFMLCGCVLGFIFAFGYTAIREAIDRFK